MKRFLPFLKRYFDDILLVAGCGCIVYGLSKWNVVVTWVVCGLMLIGFAVLVGKLKVRQ